MENLLKLRSLTRSNGVRVIFMRKKEKVERSTQILAEK